MYDFAKIIESGAKLFVFLMLKVFTKEMSYSDLRNLSWGST